MFWKHNQYCFINKFFSYLHLYYSILYYISQYFCIIFFYKYLLGIYLHSLFIIAISIIASILVAIYNSILSHSSINSISATIVKIENNNIPFLFNTILFIFSLPSHHFYILIVSYYNVLVNTFISIFYYFLCCFNANGGGVPLVPPPAPVAWSNCSSKFFIKNTSSSLIFIPK